MNKSKYLILIILVLISVTVYVTYSYFAPNIISNDINDVNVSSGKINLRIDDESIDSIDLAPINDEDYEMLAYHKSFEVISDGSLNSCASLYLNINEISDSLKSKYFKYKLIGDGVEVIGNFENASNEMLIHKNIFLEAGSVKYYDLYIWVSYDENVDQLSMLNSKINASILLKGYDVEDSTKCSY